MAKRDDIQWVSWRSFHRGHNHRTKWHARFGFARGPKATLCGKAISPIDSIPMENLGSYRRESPLINKDKTCQRCLNVATKIHEKESSQMTRAQRLYELWQRSCSAELDPWNSLNPEDKEDWDTFALNLVLDHGLNIGE